MPAVNDVDQCRSTFHAVNLNVCGANMGCCARKSLLHDEPGFNAPVVPLALAHAVFSRESARIASFQRAYLCVIEVAEQGCRPRVVTALQNSRSLVQGRDNVRPRVSRSPERDQILGPYCI